MIGPNPVLDDNIGRLLRRAYAPVRPRPELRESLERRAAQILDRKHGARRRPRPLPRVVRVVLPLAACALAIFGLRALLVAPAAPEGGGAAGLEELLAAGRPALRTSAGGTWRALTGRERREGVRPSGAFLELATPDALPAAVAVHLPDAGLELGPDGRARVVDVDGVEPRLELDRGRFTLVAGAAAGWRVDATGAGSLRLEVGRLAGALEPPDVACLDFELLEGRGAALDGGDWRALPSGPARLCGGRLAGAPPEGSALTATDGGESREGAAVSQQETGEGERTEAREPGAGPALATLAGRVSVAETDAPVPSFTLSLLRHVGLPQPSHPEIRSFEAADGRFRCDDLEPGEYTVFVMGPGLATLRLGPLQLAAGRTTDVLAPLVRGHAVRGHVVDAETGAPVGGAIVVSETDAPVQLLPFWGEEFLDEIPALARTARDGSFELSHVSPGEHVIRASHPEIGAAWAEAVDATDPDPRVLIELPRGGHVVGRAEREDGTPWGGSGIVVCSISFSSDLRPCMSFATEFVAADGSYGIANLPAGHYVVLHFADLERAAQPRVRYVEILARKEARVDFLPQRRGARVSGRVLAADGAPAAGIGVMLMDAGAYQPDRMPDWEASTCDAEGRYFFENVPAGTYALIVSAAMDREVVIQEVFTVGGPGEVVRDLRLPAGRIEGRVVDGDTREGLAGIVLVLDRRGGDGQLGFQARFTTDETGHVHATLLPPGEYTVTAHPEARYGWEQSGVFLVPSSGAPAGFELALYPGGTALVRVTDPDGRPVSGAAVFGVNARGQDVDGGGMPETDADGQVRVGGLRPGPARLRVRKQGYEPAIFTCEVRASLETTVPVVVRPLPADAGGR